MARYTVMREGNLTRVDGVEIKSGTVLVDGASRPVDCSALPSYFHALQWYGDSNPPYGEIEYAADDQGKKMPNTRFSDFTPYQYLVDAWYAWTPPVLENPEASKEAPKK